MNISLHKVHSSAYLATNVQVFTLLHVVAIKAVVHYHRTGWRTCSSFETDNNNSTIQNQMNDNAADIHFSTNARLSWKTCNMMRLLKIGLEKKDTVLGSRDEWLQRILL